MKNFLDYKNAGKGFTLKKITTNVINPGKSLQSIPGLKRKFSHTRRSDV